MSAQDDQPTSAAPIRKALLAVLVFQLALAGLLFLGDLGQEFTLSAPGRDAPGLDQPTRPGDQTRRFAPRTLPARTDGPPMPVRLTLEPDGADRALLRGEIAPGDADPLARQLAALDPPPRVIALDSPGGSVADALAIGERMRALGVETEVAAEAVCLSACPYLLAAGVERRVHPRALVGVHQHYFGENTLLPAFIAVEDIQRGQGEVMGYLIAMGVDPALMRPALLTPPEDIYLLTAEELSEFRIVTGDWDD
ncbi:MAG: ATP-dependent Clp protease proteolytic subunit [Rhodosalinus sp.]